MIRNIVQYRSSPCRIFVRLAWGRVSGCVCPDYRVLVGEVIVERGFAMVEEPDYSVS